MIKYKISVVGTFDAEFERYANNKTEIRDSIYSLINKRDINIKDIIHVEIIADND